MPNALNISDVIRRTGLTARALRFYEARGLVRPLRTNSGRRLYGASELARLNEIAVLKSAGFSLASIGCLLDGKTLDLPRLISIQIRVLALEEARLASAKQLLLSAKSRIDRGEPLDAATLCSLIKSGDRTMHVENWRSVTSDYLSQEERQHWQAAYKQLPPDHDFEARRQKWRDLGERIEAALPLDPDSSEAEAFVHEWRGLIAPIWRVASPEARAAAKRLYDHMEEWEGRADPGFSAQALRAVSATAARMRAEGKLPSRPTASSEDD